MMTVHEVSKLSGVSIRALHHYDHIGLLPATKVSDVGYRLYDAAALERLQHILLFKELEFSLKEIKNILDSPNFQREKALEQQIHLFELRIEHFQNLIDLARGIKKNGETRMNFDAFNTKKMEEYARQAKESWGTTDAYQEFEEKTKGRNQETQQELSAKLMDIFVEFGALKTENPNCKEAISLAKKLQDFITQHYYTCTDEIFLGLATMYCSGGELTENIENAGGTGTATFASNAIQAYLASK